MSGWNCWLLWRNLLQCWKKIINFFPPKGQTIFLGKMYFNHKLFGNTPRVTVRLFLGNSFYLFTSLGLRRKQSCYCWSEQTSKPTNKCAFVKQHGTAECLMDEAGDGLVEKIWFDDVFSGKVPGAIQAWRAEVDEKSKTTYSFSESKYKQRLRNMGSSFSTTENAFLGQHRTNLHSHQYQKRFKINTSPNKYLRKSLRLMEC